MEDINKKYINFIQFLKSFTLNNTKIKDYITDLEQCNTIIFISKLRQKMNAIGERNEQTLIEKSFNEMQQHLNIDLNKEKPEDIDKFKRYLLYFYRISKTIL